jgi:hypothetical protein
MLAAKNVAKRFKSKKVMLILCVCLILTGIALVCAEIYNVMQMESHVGVQLEFGFLLLI